MELVSQGVVGLGDTSQSHIYIYFTDPYMYFNVALAGSPPTQTRAWHPLHVCV